MKLISSDSIVLRRTAYRDSDWIVVFLSKEHGRMSGIARSARASRKRFGGAMEPGAIVRISHGPVKNAGLVNVQEAIVTVPTVGIVRTLERIGAVGRALALALAFLQEHEPVPEKFDLLKKWIVFCNGHDPMATDSARFELEWLKLCGYEPRLAACALCGRDAEHGAGWSFDFCQGGLVCGGGCRKVGGITLSAGTLKGLRLLSPRTAARSFEYAPAALAVLKKYADFIVGRPIADMVI